MASEAHCAYCFETLVAKLERSQPLTLTQVLRLWEEYNADVSGNDDQEPLDDEDETSAHATHDPLYRPAAVSRLMANTPSTASSSSVHSTLSTPSRQSEASSATSIGSSSHSLLSPSKQQRLEAGLSANRYPLFVTYNVLQRNGDKRLRGCIGTFEPYDLDDGLSSYALTAALDDTRFSPITARELPTLECGVTLLTDFEPISDHMDWEIGVHGLRISFTYHNRRHSSTYLPDVAREQGWTKEETLISLMRKGGWTGRKDEWKKVQLSVVRYQGSKAKLGYREYKEWRDWVEETGRD